MKKAFTMVEFILVIVIVAILAAMLIPRFADSRLREAADQILSHIRYTKHLAQIDDRFDPTSANWHQERWLISFQQCTNGEWYYVIGQDRDHGGGIGSSEAAVNPADGKRFFVSNTCVPAANESRAVLISQKFGINNVTFSQSCGPNQYIAFDQLGRPYQSTLGSTVYDFVRTTCQITFSSSDGTFTIDIEPETGYIHLQ